MESSDRASGKYAPLIEMAKIYDGLSDEVGQLYFQERARADSLDLPPHERPLEQVHEQLAMSLAEVSSKLSKLLFSNKDRQSGTGYQPSLVEVKLVDEAPAVSQPTAEPEHRPAKKFAEADRVAELFKNAVDVPRTSTQWLDIIYPGSRLPHKTLEYNFRAIIQTQRFDQNLRQVGLTYRIDRSHTDSRLSVIIACKIPEAKTTIELWERPFAKQVETVLNRLVTKGQLSSDAKTTNFAVKNPDSLNVLVKKGVFTAEQAAQITTQGMDIYQLITALMAQLTIAKVLVLDQAKRERAGVIIKQKVDEFWAEHFGQ